MEEWQRKHILSNFPSLLRDTTCNELLMARLRASNILADIDTDKIMANRTMYGRVETLYSTLLSRTNSYISLIQALKETHQTGALKTLFKIPATTIGGLLVSFKGKICTLKSLLDDLQIESIQNWLQENLFSPEVFEALQNILSKPKTALKLIRDTIPNRYFLYFPRRLTRHMELSPDIFNAAREDVFVFKRVTRAKLRNFNTSDAIEKSKSQLLRGKITARFIILETDDDWQRICDKINVPAHLIRYEDSTETFIIEATSGGSDVLHKYLKSHRTNKHESMSEEQLIETLLLTRTKGVCICDSPGMGKSLLLANLARKFIVKCPDRIIAFFQVRNFELPKNSCENRDALVSMLFTKFTTSVLAKRILLELTKKHNLNFELFFDGLDEVHQAQFKSVKLFFKSVVRSLPGSRVFVTSRPVLRAKLEKSLGVIAYNIQPFNTKTQIRYLTSYWLTKKSTSDLRKLEEYAKYCLDGIKMVLRDNELIIAGVPIQCRLIADVYGDLATIYAEKMCKTSLNCSENFVNSLSEIYSKFLIRQLGATKCEFNCMTIADFNKVQCDIVCQVTSFHVWQAFQLVFPDIASQLSLHVSNFDNLSSIDILSPGILEKSELAGGFQFLHRTFAEYLVAEYFSKKIFTISEHDNIELTEYRLILEQLAYDNIFLAEENIRSLSEYNCFSHFTLREGVVAYFLNDMLSSTAGPSYDRLCTPRIPPLADNFFCALEGCLQNRFENLSLVYLKSAENFFICRLLEHVNINYYTELFSKRISHIFSVAAEYCSKNVMHKLFLFFQNVLNFDSNNFKELNNIVLKPLKIATRRGDYDVVRYFVDKVSIRHMGLLHCCVECTADLDDEQLDKRLDVARLLLSKCMDLVTEAGKYKDNSVCVSPLLANRIHFIAIKFLVENGANLLSVDDKGRTVFFQAAGYMMDDQFSNFVNFLFTKCDTVEWFLDPIKCKTYLNSRKHDRDFGNFMLLKRLAFLVDITRCNLDITGITHTDINKLMSDREENPVEVLSKMLCQTVHLEYQNIFQDILLSAVENGHMDIVGLLINFKPSVIEVRDERKRTPLLLAANVGEADMFRFLVSKGANIFAVDNNGYTILHLSAISSTASNNTFREMVSAVSEQWSKMSTSKGITSLTDQSNMNDKKAPINILELFNWQCNEFSRTPLHYAIENIRDLTQETLDMYLACGKDSGTKIQFTSSVDINTADIDGFIPLHLAVFTKQSLDFLKHMVNRGADWSSKRYIACICARAGMLEELKYFVSLGCDINEKHTETQDTPLLFAILNRQSIQFLSVLVNLGADINARNHQGVGAVHVCATMGLFEHLKYFIKLGCDVNLADSEGSTPLYQALITGQNVEYIKCMVKLGADCIFKTNFKCTATHACATQGLLEHLKYFVGLGCDVNAVDQNGSAPLHLALRTSQSLELVKYLVTSGADVKTSDRNGCNAIHICAKNGLLEHTKYFVELGCELNAVTQDGCTPLYLALSNAQSLELVKYLVTSGADILASSHNGWNVMHVCAEKGLLEHLKYFVEVGCELNAAKDGWTPLLIALSNKQSLELVKYLVSSGADGFVSSPYGWTVMHTCAEKGLVEHLKYFVGLGCELNAVNKNGWTPLLVALSNKQSLELVKFLVASGADKLVFNLDGWDVIHICAAEGLLEHLKYFVELGCKINAVTLDGWTPLLLALSKQQSLELVKYMVASGADWLISCPNGMNITHVCAEKGLMEHLKYFVELGCNLNVVTSDGWTPLLVALSNKQSLELIKYLVISGADLTTLRKGKNIMHMCSEIGLLAHLQYFVGLGCKLSAFTSEVWTPLMLALSNKQSIEMVKFLVASGADKFVLHPDGWDVIHVCAENGLLEHMKYFADLGCELNAVSQDGWTPLHLALSNAQSPELVKFMVASGADKLVFNPDGWDVVQVCAAEGLLEHLKYFVELECKVNAVNQDGLTPLHLALSNAQSLELVKFLVASGADLLVSRLQRWHVVHVCAENGLLEHMKYFADLGCELNAVSQDGWTPLHLALSNAQSPELVKFMVASGADKLVFNPDGWDVIHVCAAEGLLEHLKYFVELECKVNAVNKDGLTPLHLALSNAQSLELVKYLVASGADWSKPDQDGWIATHFCSQKGLLEHLNYFVQLGCEVDAVAKDGRTPLLVALYNRQSLELVKYLVSCGADCSARHNHGSNTIHFCASYGLPDHLKLFVTLGCDVNVIDGDGDNALQCVVVDCKSSVTVVLEIIQLLISAGVDKGKKNNKGKTAYDCAVEKGHPPEVLNMLL